MPTIGTERLLSLNEKSYKNYESHSLGITCLSNRSHLYPDRRTSVAFKHFERRLP